MILRLLSLIIVCLLWSCNPANQDTSDSKELTIDQPDQKGDAKVDIKQVLADITFEDLKGNTLKLSDYKGKAILIDFWETWCTPCLKSFPAIQSALEQYPNDFVVLAVNLGESDTAEDIKAFADKHPEYRFIWAQDTEKLALKLNIPGIPYKIYINKDGNYSHNELGLSGSEENNLQKLLRFIETQAN
jgi:thiol-disulfide isomerase/thioredoxin